MPKGIRFPAKSRLLQKHYDKFSGLELIQIQNLLRYMSYSDSNPNKRDFQYEIHGKRTYNNCTINNYVRNDDKCLIKKLKLENATLLSQLQDICNKYNDIYTQFVCLKKKYIRDFSGTFNMIK